MNFTEIEKLEEHFQVATYTKMNIVVETGKGAWIWTSDGEKYLDLYGGHAVCATGHTHVVEALKQRLAFGSFHRLRHGNDDRISYRKNQNFLSSCASDNYCF